MPRLARALPNCMRTSFGKPWRTNAEWPIAPGVQMALAVLVAKAQPAIHVGQQPQRTDQQELHILEKRRAPAFNGVTDELTDPSEHEERHAHDPERHQCHALQLMN